jgi:hypothetical protein
MEKKELYFIYEIKAYKNTWEYIGSMRLNAWDTLKEKVEIAGEIRKKYRLQNGETLNISCFNDVYL